MDKDLQPKKKTRGSKSASIEATTTASKAELSKYVKDNARWFLYTTPQTAEEFAERLNEFFAVCAETESFPTVEKMSLALGTSRFQLNQWEKGEDRLGKVPGISIMIQKAKQILAGIDADLVQAGKIPQITYIFRSKNFFGMVDKTEHVILPNLNPENDFNADEIRSRYILPEEREKSDEQPNEI